MILVVLCMYLSEGKLNGKIRFCLGINIVKLVECMSAVGLYLKV